jgi:putative lipoic acid-binding regulatory protein
MPSDNDAPFDFPCDFPLKVMGRAGEDLDLLVAQIARRHCPDLAEGALRSQPSSHGKYVSVTVTVRARSRAQLDELYRELSAQEQVLMVL